ncbi:methylenetetrahydrofolate reductase C-terminal domain-containing protein [Herbaspirillum sp. ST 5-3]|uniref:methylenetetrahydrofolate reductase C-terminal domain-containing protein n=1 Tax=Oxalobacteraceae TaxID=75682 RepID=UPI001455FAC9|nr:methylenetetrahydrofolate reductase C-terminal domain-containing protein [Herbaspirillum sp. ST 5-3]
MRKIKSLLYRTAARGEAFLKGVAFDCRACGQCVLSQTGLICPMSCPKGLRNGPCGGTLGDRCEVYPDRACVWMRIYDRTAKDSTQVPPLNPSPDAALFFTSSYANWWKGIDEGGTTPLTYLDLPKNRVDQPIATQSRLEAALKAGRFVKTCEVRSPRNADFERLYKEIDYVKDKFDAVNATAYLNGKPSLPSGRTCIELLAAGVDAICQSTCRDHTKTSFVSELINNHANGVHNVLCLTGDSYAGNPRIKQVFDMDSSLMVFEARHLRETGAIHFTGQTMPEPPKPFIGVAINPFTRPISAPIRRLKQKIAAGADFTQTQLIFNLPAFEQFMNRFCDDGLDRDLFLLAGIPVVISKSAMKMIPHIPGVDYPNEIRERLEGAADLRDEGIKLARETVRAVSKMPGVRGVHLMLLGADHSVLPEVVCDIDALGGACSKHG